MSFSVSVFIYFLFSISNVSSTVHVTEQCQAVSIMVWYKTKVMVQLEYTDIFLLFMLG